MEKICQVYYDAAAATAEAEAYLYHASETTIRFQRTLPAIENQMSLPEPGLLWVRQKSSTSGSHAELLL